MKKWSNEDRQEAKKTKTRPMRKRRYCRTCQEEEGTDEEKRKEIIN